ncbi:MAG TPA: hypothetical protein VHL77_04595 [Ferruginibacter sp.]|jgi:hypothetical protein|nr:hypothetical protein [Ferruginibacter sp.]
MQKIFLLAAFLWPSLLFAQSVAINTDASAPDNTAILDIKSNNKGLLIPRLTTAERTAIVSPAIGLTVFDSNTASYWIFRGDLNGNWVELMHSLDKHWDRTGTNIFSTNPGNVGIGTNSPTEKLTINATDPAINFLNAGSPKGYLQASGTNMKIGTYANNTTGNIVFTTKAVDRMWIDENGKVGIGTSTPSGPLTIDGSNPWIEMRTGGVYKGYLWASGSDLRLGTSLGNTTGNLALQTTMLTRMLIDETGRIAMGTTTPVSNAILTIDAADPFIQLQNNGTSKGFLMVQGNDIKIGTNSSNIAGKFVVRTNGADRVFLDKDGELQVGNGNEGALTVDSESPIVRLKRSGIDLFYAWASASGNKDVSLSRTSQGAGNGKLIINNGVWGNIYLSEDGHVNMGYNKKPTGYRLSVEGKVIATEFTTLSVANWPDYVFAKDYNLKPLAEVKKFIEENKHLPNIPPASDVIKKGVQLGDMSKRLMEKVEELTLYILQLQEQVDDLKKQIPLKKEN